MRSPLWRRAGAVLAPLAVVAVFRGLHLVICLLSGSLTYMGTGDVQTARIAIEFYGTDMASIVRYMYLADVVVFAALLLPVWPCLVRWVAARTILGLAKTIGVLLVVQFVWIGVACIRIPSLFAEQYYGDGTSLSSHVMSFLCRPRGVALIVIGVVALLSTLGRTVGPRWRAFALGYAGLIAGVLWATSAWTPALRLPPRSVVLLLADSMRSDHFTAERMPKVWQQAEKRHALVLPAVAPPVPRTAPAVTALLTGRQPFETGVTTMFSGQETFNQRDSLVWRYRLHGYCTLNVGEYPAEFFRKIDYGFEFTSSPQVRFQEMALQILLQKDPFFLASLSWSTLRDSTPRRIRNLFEGLPTFADGRALMRRLARTVARCGGRPVFAFVFADQPHFPYVQTWPHYLALDPAYHGRYKYLKDAVSLPHTEADRQRIRDLYNSSLRASDEDFGQFLRHLGRHGGLDSTTVIVTGDHGESLYDRLGIMGHGDQLGELEGITVPWVVFGANRRAFKFPSSDAPVTSTNLSGRLLRLRDIAYDAPRFPEVGFAYVETELWMADTPNVPRERIRYPELSDLLTLADVHAQIEIKPEYVPLVNYAKHRMWLLDGARYDLVPLPHETRLTRDGVPIAPRDLPRPIQDFIAKAPDVFTPLLDY
jgi:hypothetical protein